MFEEPLSTVDQASILQFDKTINEWEATIPERLRLSTATPQDPGWLLKQKLWLYSRANGTRILMRFNVLRQQNNLIESSLELGSTIIRYLDVILERIPQAATWWFSLSHLILSAATIILVCCLRSPSSAEPYCQMLITCDRVLREKLLKSSRGQISNKLMEQMEMIKILARANNLLPDSSVDTNSLKPSTVHHDQDEEGFTASLNVEGTAQLNVSGTTPQSGHGDSYDLNYWDIDWSETDIGQFTAECKSKTH